MPRNILCHSVSEALLTLFIVLAIGSVESGRATEKFIAGRSTFYKISAGQLYREYDENEAVADRRYKGKVLEVFGYIDEIGKNKKDETYITLLGDGYVVNVQCFLSDKHAYSATQLRRRERVIVKGKCDGLERSVVLRECLIQ